MKNHPILMKFDTQQHSWKLGTRWQSHYQVSNFLQFKMAGVGNHHIDNRFWP